MTRSSACSICGEACEERLITLALPSSIIGYAVLKNVPAEVCRRCGETRFTLQTAGRMLEAIHGDGPPPDHAVVPVYDLERAS